MVDLEHSVFRRRMDCGGSSARRSGREDTAASGYPIRGVRVACRGGVASASDCHRAVDDSGGPLRGELEFLRGWPNLGGALGAVTVALYLAILHWAAPQRVADANTTVN